MTLEEDIRKRVQLGDYKKEQLDVLNYVKQVTKNEPYPITITEEQFGNVPPIIYEILVEKGCFADSNKYPILPPGSHGLSAKGEEYRLAIIEELNERK